MTVGDLRKAMEGKSDDVLVYYERIEDVYFEKRGWKTKLMPDEYGNPDEREFITAFSAFSYRNDPNLYITAHY